MNLTVLLYQVYPCKMLWDYGFQLGAVCAYRSSDQDQTVQMLKQNSFFIKYKISSLKSGLFKILIGQPRCAGLRVITGLCLHTTRIHDIIRYLSENLYLNSATLESDKDRTNFYISPHCL